MEKRERERYLKDSANLNQIYPISARLIVKRCFPAAAASMLAAFTYAVTATRISALFGAGAASSSLTWSILIFVVAGVGLKVLYELVQRRSCQYSVEDSNWIVARGLVLRQRGCFPLSQITDVYLNRSLTDFIFGLYNLNVSTPTTRSAEFASIKGLHKETALALQNHLLRLLHRDRLLQGERLRRHNRDEFSPLA